MRRERELMVTHSTDGYIVAGRCSVCHQDFETPLLNLENASNDIVRQFDDHFCNEFPGTIPQV